MYVRIQWYYTVWLQAKNAGILQRKVKNLKRPSPQPPAAILLVERVASEYVTLTRDLGGPCVEEGILLRVTQIDAAIIHGAHTITAMIDHSCRKDGVAHRRGVLMVMLEPNKTQGAKAALTSVLSGVVPKRAAPIHVHPGVRVDKYCTYGLSREGLARA